MRRQLFPLFCVGAASASAGPLVSALLVAAVAPEVAAHSVEHAPPAPQHEASLDRDRLTKLLQLEQRSTPTRSPEPFHRYRLRGTLSPMLACVEPSSGGPARSVGVGDALDDATVEEVGHGFVMLRRGDQLAQLTMTPQPLAPSPPRSSATRSVEVSRRELDDARINILSHAQQMRIVPAFQAGAAIGFKIAWLAPDALARRAGLEQGDVVTAVNGHSLTDFQQTAALAKEVSTGTRFTADIVRGGASLRLEVKAL